MQFTIEIMRYHGANREILYRAAIERASPRWAQASADEMLRTWWGRGGTCVRIFNSKGEEVYSWNGSDEVSASS